MTELHWLSAQQIAAACRNAWKQVRVICTYGVGQVKS
jgi:hypothetical protein